MSGDWQGGVSCPGPIKVSKVDPGAEQVFRLCWHSHSKIKFGAKWECDGCLEMRGCSSRLRRMVLVFRD